MLNAAYLQSYSLLRFLLFIIDLSVAKRCIIPSCGEWHAHLWFTYRLTESVHIKTCRKPKKFWILTLLHYIWLLWDYVTMDWYLVYFFACSVEIWYVASSKIAKACPPVRQFLYCNRSKELENMYIAHNGPNSSAIMVTKCVCLWVTVKSLFCWWIPFTWVRDLGDVLCF